MYEHAQDSTTPVHMNHSSTLEMTSHAYIVMDHAAMQPVVDRNAKAIFAVYINMGMLCTPRYLHMCNHSVHE